LAVAVLEFVAHLAKEKYRPNVGWACPALAIPSSEVSRLVIGNRMLGSEAFLVLDGHIRLAEGIEVGDAAATISVRRRLATARSSWFVVVAAALVALGALASAYHTRARTDCAQAR
jgi:hypothetical protein